MDTNTYSGSNVSTEKEEEYAKTKKVSFVGGSQKGICGAGSDCGKGGAVMVRCQAQGCEVNLNNGKIYHRRHKVCEIHAKSEAVIVAGLRQRFCQQCSRFHQLSYFDFAKRSCRSRLAGHNERRRKSLTESPGEGTSAK